MKNWIQGVRISEKTRVKTYKEERQDMSDNNVNKDLKGNTNSITNPLHEDRDVNSNNQNNDIVIPNSKQLCHCHSTQ